MAGWDPDKLQQNRYAICSKNAFVEVLCNKRTKQKKFMPTHWHILWWFNESWYIVYLLKTQSRDVLNYILQIKAGNIVKYLLWTTLRIDRMVKLS